MEPGEEGSNPRTVEPSAEPGCLDVLKDDTCYPLPLVEAWSWEGQGQAQCPAVSGVGYGSDHPTWTGCTMALFSG